MFLQAVSKQSRVESIITRFATWFTPIIIAACLGIALIPIAAGVRDKSRWVYLSLQILVTACPCALVLSTPVTVVAGLAASARQGVLIKVTWLVLSGDTSLYGIILTDCIAHCLAYL